MERSYAAVAESTHYGSWSAFVPDLPGPTAGGVTAAEAAESIGVSIKSWLEEAISAGIEIPEPSTEVRRIATVG